MNLPIDSKKIPATSKPFFPEYDPDSLDVEQHASLIIERILAQGSRSEVRWLLDTYSKDRIFAWMAFAGYRRLSKRRYHLWCFVFGLPEQKITNRIWPH